MNLHGFRVVVQTLKAQNYIFLHIQVCQLLLSLSHLDNAEICFITGRFFITVQFTFFHDGPQHCFQKLLLKHQWWVIAQNNIATSLTWHRQWLCVLQNLSCSIQEQAAVWELLKETLRGKPVEASRNANGPPKKSYQLEGWKEAYSLFFCHATKILLERKNPPSSQYGHHWHVDYLLQITLSFFSQRFYIYTHIHTHTLTHTYTQDLFWTSKQSKTHRGSILRIHANVRTDNPLETRLHFYLILFEQSLNLISSICKKIPIIEAVKRYGLFSPWLHPLFLFPAMQLYFFFFYWCDVLPCIMACVFSVTFTQVMSLMLGTWIQNVHFSTENTKILCALGYHN